VYAFGRRGVDTPGLDDARRIAELERKIGQLTMENDFLKKALQHFKDHHPPAVVSGADACSKKSVSRERTPSRELFGRTGRPQPGGLLPFSVTAARQSRRHGIAR
jgi:hypothetical protein